jgi:hypothetical protein
MDRMRMAALASLWALAGCAGAPLPDVDRPSLARGWEGKTFYLRSSLNVMPFFADASRRLASPLFPDSILLLQDSQGAPIPPGPVEEVLPMGTRVRVDRVEFPSGLVVARRPPNTPRHDPWVYLSVPGRAPGRPYVTVLRHNLASREEYLAEVNELLSEDEPVLWLKSASPETRAAIEKKELLPGMDADAVALSWGRPVRIKQELDQGVRVETWTWPLKKRQAVFREGKLIAATPELTPGPDGSVPR